MKQISTPAVIVTFLITFGLLAGCPSQESGTDNGSNTTIPPEGQGDLHPGNAREIAEGGILRLPLEISIDDPAIRELDFTVPQLWALARAIEMPVLGCRHGSDGVPGFAVIEQVGGNGQTWTLNVLNTKESTGAPIEFAQKIVDHWKEILTGEMNPLRAQLMDLVEGAADYANGRALDVTGLTTEFHLIKINLNRPYYNFSSWLTQPGLGLVNRGDLPLTGYGPFVLSAIEGNELVLKPNPDYVGETPVLDELRFICEPDREAQVEMFRSGELDAANIRFSKAARIEQDQELNGRIVKHETATTYLGVFNYSRFPWDDGEFQSRKGVRQAMNWGIDRETLETMLNGQIAAYPHFLPKAYEKYVDPADLQQPLYPLSQRIEDARLGLKLADHDQGIRLPTGMDLAFLPEDNVDDLVINVLEYWNEVSVKMGPFGEPRETLFKRVEDARHEVVLRPVRPAYPGPDALIYTMLHGNLTGLGGNWSMIDEEGMDTAIEAAMVEADPVALQLKLHRIGHELEERSLFVFLGYGTPTLLINRELGGYELSPADYDASLNNQDFTKLGFYVK